MREHEHTSAREKRKRCVRSSCQVRSDVRARNDARKNISLNRENETKFSSSNSYPSKPFLRLAGFDFHPRFEFTVLFTCERERRREREVSLAHISCVKRFISKVLGKRMNLKEFETRVWKVLPKRVSCRFCLEASLRALLRKKFFTTLSRERCNRVLWVLRNRSIDRRLWWWLFMRVIGNLRDEFSMKRQVSFQKISRTRVFLAFVYMQYKLWDLWVRVLCFRVV